MSNRSHKKTRQSEIWIEDEEILCLKFNEDAEIDIEEARACFGIYKDLGFGPNKKVLQLIDGSSNFIINSDARTFVAKEGKNFFHASAIVSENLAIRLLVNFFNRIHKQEVPFKMFSSEKKARQWLKKFGK